MASRDFLDIFLEWTEAVPSPYSFRLWSGIACVAGALERRVWALVYARPTYPNLFIALVATPGVGKQVVEECAYLWRGVRTPGSNKRILHVAPHSSSAAALLQALNRATRIIIKDGAILDEYHSLQVAAEEMSVFMPTHDLEFLGRLNYIFTNPALIEVERVYMGKEPISILNPHMNILTGAQPGFLSSLLPDEAWSMGFTARLLMIYASTGPHIELFARAPMRESQEKELLTMLGEICELHGQMEWEPRAMELLANWHATGKEPVPSHSRLIHYNQRRLQFVIKLATISAIARTQQLLICHEDVVRAKEWLLTAEEKMPDVFREMVHRSDMQVIQETHFWAMKEWVRRGKKPITGGEIARFLTSRVPSEKITRLMDVLIHANIFTREAGSNLWTPRPHTDWGVE